MNPNDVWIIGAIATFGSFVFALLAWSAQSGQLVGSMPCKRSRAELGGKGKGQLKVYRKGTEPGGMHVVTLMLKGKKVADSSGFSTQDALALADSLDEAARKAGAP